jgi:cation diffusion facilitator CzcD-associated flavoprotein CzcO
MSTTIEVAVVGAGPHGLSTTVHLRRAGVEAHAFGPPMSFWKGMPEGMTLRSNLSATAMVETVGPLSLRSYEADTGVRVEAPVPLSTFLDYGAWVQRNGVPDLDERTVRTVDRSPEGFALELSDGERLTARRVVVAAGIGLFSHIPAGFEHLPRGRVSHTGDHRRLADFAGRRVALVGGGQSAFECAALMAGHGAEPEVLVRKRDVVWLRGHAVKTRLGPLGPILYAPTDVGPLWYSRLVATPGLFRLLPRASQDRIAYRAIRPACSYVVAQRLDDVRLTLGAHITEARESGGAIALRLSDGTTREVDHLMFGTGYRIDVGRYPFLAPRLLAHIQRHDGYPVLRGGLESSLPGLHFVGAPAAWSFGPTMRFVSGSWYAGRAVARAVEAARV